MWKREYCERLEFLFWLSKIRADFIQCSAVTQKVMIFTWAISGTWRCLSMIQWKPVRTKAPLLHPACSLKPCMVISDHQLLEWKSTGNLYLLVILSTHPHFTGAETDSMKLWSTHLCASTQSFSKQVFQPCCKTDVCISHFRPLTCGNKHGNKMVKILPL